MAKDKSTVSAPLPPVLARVTNTRPTFLDIPGVGQLGPGESRNVLDSIVATLDDLPPGKGVGKVWTSLQDSGWVRVVRASASEAKAATQAPEGVTAPPSLVELPEAGAVALASVEDSRDVLAAWKKAERREPVRSAIEARMAALSA